MSACDALKWLKAAPGRTQTEAAERFEITQSALSQYIARHLTPEERRGIDGRRRTRLTNHSLKEK